MNNEYFYHYFHYYFIIIFHKIKQNSRNISKKCKGFNKILLIFLVKKYKILVQKEIVK